MATGRGNSVIEFMLSRDKVSGCCNLVGTGFNGAQRIGFTVPVVDELRWRVPTSSQFFLRNYRWQVRFGCRRRGGAKLEVHLRILRAPPRLEGWRRNGRQSHIPNEAPFAGHGRAKSSVHSSDV